MKRSKNVVVTIFIAAAVIVASLGFVLSAMGAEKVQGTEAATVLADLQAAYNGESNAHARYLAFAKKAQEEGYLKVASLFRATAKSEEIHANNHAAVIKKMGAAPAAVIEAPKVKSTRENLEEALKGETYEKDKMYPEFLARAEAEKRKDAVRTFTYAKNVEANHAKLYSEALNNLEAWKVAGVVFYDCGECGNTVEKVDFKRCPVCHEPRSRYFKVS